MKITQFVPKGANPQNKPLAPTKNNEALPVKEPRESSIEKKLEHTRKNCENDQNQEVANEEVKNEEVKNEEVKNEEVKNEDQQNNSNLADSEIRYQDNYWDNFYYRGHPTSQPYDFYDTSLSRDPEIAYRQYYGKHGFEQQRLPYQSQMHEQMVSDQYYYQRYPNQSYFGQEQNHKH